MRLLTYLDDNRCVYKVTEHKPVYTAGQLASVEHVPERQVAKPVVVCADGRFCLCVLTADRMVDLHAVQKHLKAKDVRLANEQEMETIFADAELGAEPPMGVLYNLPTLMDKKLSKDKEIVFQAGSHHQAVWISTKEYIKMANPTIGKFSRPSSFEELDSGPWNPFFYGPYV